jgi:hypothetical protein
VRQHSIDSNDSKLGYYLAGLWEGDGHILIPNKTHAPSGKRYFPHFSITFHEIDKPLIETLKEIIGGTIRYKEENHACVLTISSLSGLKLVVSLLNGKLRTPKIIKFNNMIDWINNYTAAAEPESANFLNYSVDTTPLIENGWLSGFIDADGSFDIRVTQKSQNHPKNSVSARFRIEQRKHDPVTGDSYLNLFQHISKTLGVTVGYTIHKREANEIEYLIINLSSLKSRKILIEYLDSFPLFTSKFMNYIDWKECHKIMVDNLHLTEEGRNKAICLKSGMNRKRNYFNWDHLNCLANAGLS